MIPAGKASRRLRTWACLVLLGVTLLSVACGREDSEKMPSPAIRKDIQYTLTYSASDHGSVAGAARQTVHHGEDGSEVTAVAESGYQFVNWSDGVKTPKRTDRKVTADLAVTAEFALGRHALTYSAGDHGTIDGSVSQILGHGADASAVTAVPDENYHFTGWSDGVKTPTRTDRNVKTDIAVTAVFEINRHALTYLAAEYGKIEGAVQQVVDHAHDGGEVRAIAQDGYHFTGWSDGVKTPARTDRNVKADITVTAGFEVNRHTLTYKAGQHGTIAGASQQTVNHGEDGSEVTAVAEGGYQFVKWSDGLDTARRIDAKVSGDLSVSAVFAEKTYAVGGKVSGLVEGTQLILQNQSGEDLAVTANGDFRFAAGLREAESYAVAVKVQPVSPNQTCTVSSGSGRISAANVTNVEVACILNVYTIGGIVTGLSSGDRVVLKNNAGDELVVKNSGPFSFAVPLKDGKTYKVTVSSPPTKPNWVCDVANAEGTMAGRSVNDVTVFCYVKPVLQATPGNGTIKLGWNAQDFSGATFQLCRSQQKIPEGDRSPCQDFEGGTLEQKVGSPFVARGLTNDVPYWFRLSVQHADGRLTNSDVVQAMAFSGLNDTGIDWCADDRTNRMVEGSRAEKEESCKAIAGSHPGQDALYGRDAMARNRKLAKNGSGAAGFDFTKICRNGKAAGDKQCPPNPAPGNGPKNWGCTRDNATGLVWEVKDLSGLHARDSTYSWYNPDKTVNGGDPGVKNGGKCEGSSCDTQDFVQKVNASELCGLNSWRLPTRRELLSIVNNGSLKPSVDVRFFPNTVPDYYWSSTPYAEQKGLAWQVYFLYGESYQDEKSQSKHLRLVSGRTVTFGLDNP